MAFILELLVELVLEVLLELSFGAFQVREIRNRVLSALLWFVLGLGVGGGLSYFFPGYFVTMPPWPTIGLVVLPLAGGVCMHVLGTWRKRRGKRSTSLATFYGGASLAFGLALVRFLAMDVR